MKINSSLSTAGQVSAKLSQVASALSAVQAPSAFAERTTVLGNEQAKGSGERLVAAAHSVSNALTKDGNHVHSVAQEFAAIDQHVHQQFEAMSILSSPIGGKK